MLLNYLPYLLAGIGLTLALALCALVLGLAIGLIGCMARLSQKAWLRGLAGFYVSILRSLPEFLTILIVYYGVGAALSAVSGAMGFGPMLFSAFAAGVVALSLEYGAYSTEVLRGAYQSIPPGQHEAGHAIGMTRWQVALQISLPQMVRQALPPLGNLFLVLQKNSALVSVIGVEELMRRTHVVAGSTHKPMLFYGAAAAGYLTITAASMLVQQMLERKMTYSSRGR